MSDTNINLVLQWSFALFVSCSWLLGWITGTEATIGLLVFIMNTLIVVHIDNE